MSNENGSRYSCHCARAPARCRCRREFPWRWSSALAGFQRPRSDVVPSPCRLPGGSQTEQSPDGSPRLFQSSGQVQQCPCATSRSSELAVVQPPHRSPPPPHRELPESPDRFVPDVVRCAEHHDSCAGERTYAVCRDELVATSAAWANAKVGRSPSDCPPPRTTARSADNTSSASQSDGWFDESFRSLAAFAAPPRTGQPPAPAESGGPAGSSRPATRLP